MKTVWEGKRDKDKEISIALWSTCQHVDIVYVFGVFLQFNKYILYIILNLTFTVGCSTDNNYTTTTLIEDICHL